jgi:hypothetical protein
MNIPHRWKKASFSGPETNCVEVAYTLREVRDSKNPTGSTLKVDVRSFIAALKSDDFGS